MSVLRGRQSWYPDVGFCFLSFESIIFFLPCHLFTIFLKKKKKLWKILTFVSHIIISVSPHQLPNIHSYIKLFPPLQTLLLLIPLYLLLSFSQLLFWHLRLLAWLIPFFCTFFSMGSILLFFFYYFLLSLPFLSCPLQSSVSFTFKFFPSFLSLFPFLLKKNFFFSQWETLASKRVLCWTTLASIQAWI